MLFRKYLWFLNLGLEVSNICSLPKSATWPDLSLIPRARTASGSLLTISPRHTLFLSSEKSFLLFLHSTLDFQVDRTACLLCQCRDSHISRSDAKDRLAPTFGFLLYIIRRIRNSKEQTLETKTKHEHWAVVWNVLQLE